MTRGDAGDASSGVAPTDRTDAIWWHPCWWRSGTGDWAVAQARHDSTDADSGKLLKAPRANWVAMELRWGRGEKERGSETVAQ